MKHLRRLSLFIFVLVLSFAFLIPVSAATTSTPKNKIVSDGTDSYYYNSKGTLAKDTFVTISGKTYYFRPSGRMLKDTIFTRKKKTYCADRNGVIAKNKLVIVDGKLYFFDKSGIRKTGWIDYNHHTYYCPSSGEIYKSCWKKIGNYEYYFSSSLYIRKNRWVDDYYIDNKGHKTNIKVAAAESSNKKVIKMSNIKQYPQLPTGCESVALTMVLKYYGFSLSKTTIASSYLPKSSSNFVTAFWGSPFSSSGGGIYSPGLTTTANKYLKAKKSSMKAYDISGIKFSQLYRYIDNNIPVIVWNSMYMRNPVAVYSYYCKGKTWRFYQSEHCVVLCGYDKAKKKVLINDSLSGLVWRSASSFERIYNKLGKMAVVIK